MTAVAVSSVTVAFSLSFTVLVPVISEIPSVENRGIVKIPDDGLYHASTVLFSWSVPF